MATRTLLIEIDYNEDLTVSSAHAMVGALASGEGVTQVRARLKTERDAIRTPLPWDSAEHGSNAGQPQGGAPVAGQDY